MARRYHLEQPAALDPAAQNTYGSQQRAMDAIGKDIDSLQTTIGSDLTTLEGAVEGYTPADAGDWDGTAPSTKNDALDRIAAAVAGLLGAPIP